MLLKRLLIIIKSNKVILRRRDSINGIRDCQDCFATKNVPVSFFLGHCYLDCANICYRYGKYKRYYAEEKDNREC